MTRKRIKIVYQRDCMQCGIACLSMICQYYGIKLGLNQLENYCHATVEGISLLSISEAANKLGFKSISLKTSVDRLDQVELPCILHWNQNHFVVLYKISQNGKAFKIADPGKGLTTYTRKEFKGHWISSVTDGEPSGTVMQLIPTQTVYEDKFQKSDEKRSFSFLFGYLNKYRKYFVHIIIGLVLGCLLQLVLPFLTQAIVDEGIKHKDIGFIWLILLGELMIVISRTATDCIRRWLLLHISMRINISLVSDFLSSY